jgi:hypothetical protein
LPTSSYLLSSVPIEAVALFRCSPIADAVQLFQVHHNLCRVDGETAGRRDQTRGRAAGWATQTRGETQTLGQAAGKLETVGEVGQVLRQILRIGERKKG